MSINEIVISSGHGKHVSGAVGILNEVTEARKVVNRVAELMDSLGIKVTKYHDDTSKTQTANVNGIVKFHNSKKRDLDISIHFNAFKKTDKPMGTEVLYYSEDKLADKVSAAISKFSGLLNRGAKERTNLGFLEDTHEKAILIEVCFVDSESDAKIYHEKFDKICEAIAESITGKQIKAPEIKPVTKLESKSKVKVEVDATKKYVSIVEYLQDHNQPYDFVSRCKLAKKHGIKGYNGRAEQNMELLKILQK